MPRRVSNCAQQCEGQRRGLTSQLITHRYTHTCTNTHLTTEFPQGGADSGSVKTGKWPNNKKITAAQSEENGLIA